MSFWVHGRDSATGETLDSLFLEVDSEADARAQATEAGMTVEEVERVRDAPREDPPRQDAPCQDPPKAIPAERLRCARCGSERVVPRAAIWDRDSQGGGGSLQAYVYTKPDALVFKGTVYATLYARVCADCGHAELFADGAEVLYKAYQQSRAEERS